MAKEEEYNFFWRTGFCVFGRSRGLSLGEATKNTCGGHTARKHKPVTICPKRNSL